MLIVCLCGLFLLVSNADATTYVFGENLMNQSLTASGTGSTWENTDTYIIAGDCYVTGGETLTIEAGVTVYFDYDYDGDYMDYPTILVRGSLICNGTQGAHVTFTNYSGTNKGEFEGIKVDDDSTATQGVLKCDYTDFSYGGRTDGLITIEDYCEVELDHCVVSLSDNDGIQLQGDYGYLTLDHCEIKNCDNDGLGWNGSVGEAVDSIRIEFSDFHSNSGDGSNGPPFRDQYIIHNDRYSDNGGWGASNWDLAVDENRQAIITNSFFYGNDLGGLLFANAVVENPLTYIYNSAFFRNNGPGMQIDDCALFDEIELYNCVFLDNDDEAILITDWDFGANWPADYDFQYNIFISNDSGISIPDQDPLADPDVPANNAFKTSDCVNCDNSNCVLDGAAVGVNLVNEDAMDPLDIDFHILWDSHNSLINKSVLYDDPDGSMGDYGIHSTTVEPFFVDEWDDVNWDDGNWICLGAGDFNRNATIPQTIYHMDGTFTVARVPPLSRTYTIEAGTEFLAFDTDAEIHVDGILVADAEGEETITFSDGTTNGWCGIYFDTWSFGVFNNVKVSEVTSNGCPAIDIFCLRGAVDLTDVEVCDNEDEGIYVHGEAEAFIEFSDIHDNSYGIEIGDQSFVIIENSSITNSENDGIYFYGGSDLEMIGTWMDSNEDDGIYVKDADPGDVDLFEVRSRENGVDETNSAGIYLKNAYVYIDDTDNDGDESLIDNNFQYGIYLDPESVIDMNEDADGHTQISGNASACIYSMVDPLDWDNYGLSDSEDGHDDFEPEDGEVAIEFSETPGDVIIATENWWGAANPDAEDVSNFAGQVDYDSPAANGYVDDIPSFRIAESLFSDGHYERSIEHFEDALFDAENRRYYSRSLRFLRSAYKRSDRDLEDLRTYFSSVARQQEDRRLASKALRQNVLTLRHMGEYDQMLELLIERRNTLDILNDSLTNEMDIASVEHDIGRMRRVRGERRNRINSSLAYEERIAELYQLKKIAASKDINGYTLLPSTPTLSEIYPNPFNSSVRIQFSVNDLTPTHVSIFNATGQNIETLFNGVKQPGKHNITWDAKNKGTGVYFIRLQTPDFTQTERITLIK